MKRLGFIDALKGLGIILIIFGHISRAEVLKTYIYSFHVPLFFFLSGYVIDISKYNRLKEFLVKKCKNLIVPYFIFSFISYGYWAVFEIKYRSNQNTSLLKSFIAIFYSHDFNGYMDYNGALWFITCMFMIELIFYLITRKVTDRKLILLVLGLIGILSYLYNNYVGVKLPWSIDVALTGVIFYGVGYIFKTVQQQLDFIKGYYRLIVIFVLMLINIVTCFLNGQVDVDYNKYNNYMYFYIAAFAGIVAYFYIFKGMNKFGILQYYGRNTLLILCVHEPIKRIIIIAISFLSKVSVMGIRTSYFWTIITEVSILIALVPIIFIINKYLPILSGKGWRKGNLVEAARVSEY